MSMLDILNEIDSNWDAPARESHSLHMQLIEQPITQADHDQKVHPLWHFFNQKDIA